MMSDIERNSVMSFYYLITLFLSISLIIIYTFVVCLSSDLLVMVYKLCYCINLLYLIHCSTLGPISYLGIYY